METETTTICYGIPLDITMDILRILLRGELHYKITGVREKESIIVFEIKFIKDNKIHKQAQDNLEQALLDYKEFMDDLIPDEETLFMGDENE